MGFLTVFSFIFLVLCIISFFREPKVTGYYKVIGVYGRIYAYWAVGCIVTPLIAIPLVIDGTIKENTVLTIMMSVVFFAVGVLLYIRVYHKTPDFMKKRCLLDLTVSGLGTVLRVSLFIFRLFFRTWWVVAGPRTYTIESTGESVYVYPNGKVYNPQTGKFGTADSDFKTVVFDK